MSPFHTRHCHCESGWGMCQPDLSSASQMSQNSFLSLFSEEYIGGKGDYVSFHPPRFSLVSYQPSLPSRQYWPSGWWVCHCKWFSLINGAFDWSNPDLAWNGQALLFLYQKIKNDLIIKKAELKNEAFFFPFEGGYKLMFTQTWR